MKRKWWKSEEIQIAHSEDFGGFMMDIGLDVNLKGVPFNGERYRKIPNLMEETKNTSLNMAESGDLRSIVMVAY